MWTIVEHRSVGRQIESIPGATLKRYETWKDVATLSGLDGVGSIEGFRDEPRPGKKKGRRQSWLDAGWRVVYRVRKREIRVRAIRGQ